jgi:PAS domain S-box-containing protein
MNHAMMLSLKTKILLLYAVVGTCLALLIGTLLSSRLKEDRFAAIYSDFQHRLNHVDFSLTSFFQGVEADLRALTLNEFVGSRDDASFTSFLQADPETFEYRIGELEQRIIDLFHNYKTTHRYVNSVYMGRENGSFVRSHKRAKPTQYDPRERPWYTLAKANPGSVARTAPYSSVTSPDINVGVVTPLLDEKSGIYGVVGMDVTLTDLTTFIENVRAGRSGYMILMDENGVILASRDKQSLFKNVYDVYQGDLGPLFQKHLGYASVTRDGISEYLFFQTSLGLNWRLGILMPATEIEEDIDAFVNRILLALLVSLGLLSALTLGGLQNFVIRPLKKLSEGADFIARTGDLDHPIDIRSGDEIGNLGRSFKRMIETVARTEASLKASEAELTKHRDHLEELVEARTAELMKAQDQLREAEERSRLILESAGEGIIGVDQEGKITFVNPATCQMLGYSPDQLIGQNLHSLIHHSHADGSPYPRENCPMYQSFSLGTASHVDDEVLWRKGGTSFPAAYSSTPVRKDGAVVGAVVTFRDITERKKAEEKIRNSEQRLGQIIDFLPDATMVIDNDGKVVAWNKAMQRLTGIEARSMVGKGDHEYALPFYGAKRPILIDLVRDWDGECERKYLSVRKEGENLISESFHPSLGEGGAYLSGTAGLLYDTSGTVTGAIESIRDVSVTKRAEMELRKLYRAIEQSPTTVVITDPSGTIEYVNPKFTEVTGYSAEEALGQNPKVLKSDVHPPEYYKELWETISTGKPWYGELCNKKKNGDLFWESASISPVRNANGEITHFVAVKEDITERKKMEEELILAKKAADEANKAKGDFLANMSHEIRTPMNAVIGMAHLTLQTRLTPKQEDYLKKIQRSAHSLLGIINDILDFSKIEAGKMHMESVDFSLDEVLDNVSTVVGVKAHEKNLEFLMDTAQDVPLALVGDPLRLGQVLINLCNNAVKFTDQGEIMVSTRVEEKGEQETTLRFSVRDTGVGLTEEQKGRLFQAFSQADTSTTRKYGGTGLGLTISKRLVEMMEGEIWFESEPGKGSEFIFTATFGLARKIARRRLEPSVDLRGMRVLVVDDNASSREILQTLLESMSFEVSVAASAEEGIAELEKEASGRPYRLVVMDWMMPGMDGIKASEAIKRHPGIPEKPKVIIATAYGREEVMQRSEKAGVDGFLLKPVGQSVLFDAIMIAFGKEVPDPDRGAEAKGGAEEDLAKIRGARVLLAEDNEINQQVAQEILERGGLAVHIAGNGKEALERVRCEAYDAVLMDIQMPVMGGFEATREIRKEERFRDLPIIAMTAHAMAGDREKSLEAGMNDHVTKPIDPDQLFSTLVRWIKPGERQAGQGTCPASEEEKGADDLPLHLPGISMASGLERVGGNVKLYTKLLGKFRRGQENACAEIRAAIESGDRETAVRLAHTVKGVSGNLGADALYLASAELEKVLKEGADENFEQAMVEFDARLHEVMEGIEAYEKSRAAQKGESPAPTGVTLDKDAVAGLLAEMSRLLESDLTEAMERLEALGEHLAHSPAGEEFTRLERHVEGFDTDGAQKSLEKIAGILNLPLAGAR